MLFLIGTALVGLIVAYIIYTIVTSSGSDLPDNSFEAFLIESHSSENPGHEKVVKKKVCFQPQYELPGRQILILYATEYGFSQSLAEELFEMIMKRLDSNTDEAYPWQPRVVNAKHFDKVDLSQESVLFVIISTAGDGVPPTDAREFVRNLQDASPGSLAHLRYSVLALGDSNYVYFCRAGRTVDERLRELGGVCLSDRRDVDSEDREKICDWFNAVLTALNTLETPPTLDYLRPIVEENTDENAYTRDRPYHAVLKTKYSLTHSSDLSDDKETIHCEFDLADSGISWTAGDALGIYPRNDSLDVNAIIRSLGLSGQEMVHIPKWAPQPQEADTVSIVEALQCFYDLKHIKPELLLMLLNHSTDGSNSHKTLSLLLKDGLYKSNTILNNYLYEREVKDIVSEFKDAVVTVLGSRSSICEGLERLLQEIRPLLPRYYSMSSSWIVNPTEVCVTAAVVRYETLGIQRSGVTTTYLQDRMTVGQRCPVFISKNPDFRLPSDGNTPIIMIGPGTGIAPFRAFIQERIHNGAEGANVFYFGCRRERQDFLYADQLNGWMKDDKLSLRVAFSRENPSLKVYVQHLLLQDSAAIWCLLSHGTHIYVCGDARNMAHDVHNALVQIVRTRGGIANRNKNKNNVVINGECGEVNKSNEEVILNGNVKSSPNSNHHNDVKQKHSVTDTSNVISSNGKKSEILRNVDIKVNKDGGLHIEPDWWSSDSYDEMSEDEAQKFLKNLEEEGKYQKDCWIT